MPSRLPAIDRLEGFHPGGPSLYRRVLVPVLVNGAVLPAWLYMDENPMSRRFTPLGESRWPR
ncbi:MAG: gamma-glutamylcyclotransferase [Desulfomonilia bacterium]